MGGGSTDHYIITKKYANCTAYQRVLCAEARMNQ